jgi:hypothetical protein
MVLVRLVSEKEQNLHLLVSLEPVHIPMEGILPARVISRLEMSAHKTPTVTSQDGHAVTRARCAHVMIANFIAGTDHP